MVGDVSDYKTMREKAATQPWDYSADGPRFRHDEIEYLLGLMKANRVQAFSYKAYGAELAVTFAPSAFFGTPTEQPANPQGASDSPTSDDDPEKDLFHSVD